MNGPRAGRADFGATGDVVRSYVASGEPEHHAQLMATSIQHEYVLAIRRRLRVQQLDVKGYELFLEDDPAADDGTDHLDVLDVLGTNRRVVGRKYREVREFARCDRAFGCFVARRERTRRCV